MIETDDLQSAYTIIAHDWEVVEAKTQDLCESAGVTLEWDELGPIAKTVFHQTRCQMVERLSRDQQKLVISSYQRGYDDGVRLVLSWSMFIGLIAVLCYCLK